MMVLRWPLVGAPPSINGASIWRKQQSARLFVFTSSPFLLTTRITPSCGASACRVYTTRLSTVASLLDPRVFGTSLSASSNLIALCGFIILMQKYGQITSDTAPVLSQVSFNLAIPCFLMTKVSETISTHRDWKFLSLPLMAFVQITIGSFLGKLSIMLLYPTSKAVSHEGKSNENSPTKALLIAACAFGNTVTLPLVFLNGMLPQTDYSTAAGYLALYMIGWSPCLWTLGYQILSSTSRSSKSVANDLDFSLHNLVKQWKRIMNPPLYGVLLGLLIGATPLSYLCLPAKHRLLSNVHMANSPVLSVYRLMATILQPILEGAKLLGSATVPLQMIILASSLASSMGSDHDSKEKLIARSDGTTTNILERSITDRAILDLKAFLASTIIRLLIMPCVNLTLLTAIRHQGWLPTDSLSILVLLVLSAMPTAQNLVVLAQINSDTRSFAGVLANILMRQYLLAVVSLTIWIPTFFTFLQLG